MHATGAARGHGFGTIPVFLTSVSAILGAIMFLRFGYAVGHVGLLGALAIIALGHLVTVPTALALSEIATNRKVEGGGEYYIISRSFGLRIGSAIGVARWLSEAVEFALYALAFAEAARPLAPWFERLTGVPFDPRFVALPVAIGLVGIMLAKGAELGIAALYVVVAVVAASLALFLLGEPIAGHAGGLSLTERVGRPDAFFTVFAICFPAFTGITQGVNLSGDLRDPSRSIPRGTMLGTAVGLVVFLAVVWKLADSAPPEALAGDPLVMSQIALWGPIIPIGLACATLSAAIGSIMGSPRMLQAIGRDRCFPLGGINRVLARGRGQVDEPQAATLVTGIIAVGVVMVGDINLVARLMSMFLMLSYGSICAISFLEHFAASPSYRPTFRSRWYLSLTGAVACGLLMFQMDPVFAVLAILAMVVLYWLSRFSPAGAQNDVAELFRGVMSQATRHMRIRLQRSAAGATAGARGHWRPSILSVSNRTFEGGARATLSLLGWVCERHGFGTYLHHSQGMLNRRTYDKSKEIDRELVELVREVPGVSVDTVVSPSYRTALAQTLQVPGVSGMENNTVLFAFPAGDPRERIEELVDGALFASEARKNLLTLRYGEQAFGARRRIHIWLNWSDSDNAPLMTLLAYILVGHRDWRRAEISIFAAFPADQVEEQRARFEALMEAGRIPIRKQNVRFHSVNDGATYHSLVEQSSVGADLVILGAPQDALADKRGYLLTRYPTLGDVLFVTAVEHVEID
jgi:amino acid transporter